MAKRTVADELAEILSQAVAKQRKAGRALHDDAGPLLSAAGLRLQLLKMDFPDLGERIQEVMGVLEQAMEGVRAVSQSLNSSPLQRSGLKNALTNLVESGGEKFSGKLRLVYESSVRPPAEIESAIYDAVAAAVSDAVERANATLIQVSVRGSKQMSVRVKSNRGGIGSHRRLAVAALLARHAGLVFEVSAGEGTIVNISHVLRRPARG